MIAQHTTPEQIAREFWRMIDAHDGPPAFEDFRHIAQNVSTRLNCSILACEEVAMEMRADMLKAGIISA